MLKNIFRAVSKILRRMGRALRKGLAPLAGFGDGLLSSLFSRPVYEDVEESSAVVDTEMEQVFEAEAPAPVPVSLLQLAKTASIHLESGRPYAGIFELQDPSQAALYAWMQSLDEAGRRMLQHVKYEKLCRHLDVSDSMRCPGLPAYPVSANENAPASARASSYEEMDRLEAAGQALFV